MLFEDEVYGINFTWFRIYSGVKVVNQLLAGVHIAVSAEAMAFGARLGLDTETLYQIIQNSESSSWYSLVWQIVLYLSGYLESF